MKDIETLIKKLEGYIFSDTLILKNLPPPSDPNNVAFLPVRPDWNEPKKMWGYYNPLTGLFYPTDGLKVLLNAFQDFVKTKNKGKRYFIILDEMNLARVEYYMSDLLSLMENMCKKENEEILIGEFAMVHPLSRCVLSKLPEKYEEEYKKYVKETEGVVEWAIEGEKICKEECKDCPYWVLKEGKKEQKVASDSNRDAFINDFFPIPPRIAYPPNLVIMGTVNVDETTFSFAPKVLDRAFVIEFNEVKVDDYLTKFGIESEPFKKFVNMLNSILEPATLHFGYRVIHEMWEYLEESGEKNKPSAKSLDFLLKSKVLPKIHGGEERVEKVLRNLLVYCVSDEYREGAEKLEKEAQWWKKGFNEIKDIISNKPQSADSQSKTPENKGEPDQGQTSEPANAKNKEETHQEQTSTKEGEERKESKAQSGKLCRYEESAKKILEMYRRLKDTGYCSYF